jgi:hypothetical protein
VPAALSVSGTLGARGQFCKGTLSNTLQASSTTQKRAYQAEGKNVNAVQVRSNAWLATKWDGAAAALLSKICNQLLPPSDMIAVLPSSTFISPILISVHFDCKAILLTITIIHQK